MDFFPSYHADCRVQSKSQGEVANDIILHSSSVTAEGSVPSAVVDILKLSHSQVTSRATPPTVNAVLRDVPAAAYANELERL